MTTVQQKLEVQSPLKPAAAVPGGGRTLHVRNIGIGGCKTEVLLEQTFAPYGNMVAALIRDRVDAQSGDDTSWALVTMETRAAALSALHADRIMAPDDKTQLDVALYDPMQAAKSTGALGFFSGNLSTDDEVVSVAQLRTPSQDVGVTSVATPRTRRRRLRSINDVLKSQNKQRFEKRADWCEENYRHFHTLVSLIDQDASSLLLSRKSVCDLIYFLLLISNEGTARSGQLDSEDQITNVDLLERQIGMWRCWRDNPGGLITVDELGHYLSLLLSELVEEAQEWRSAR